MSHLKHHIVYHSEPGASLSSQPALPRSCLGCFVEDASALRPHSWGPPTPVCWWCHHQGLLLCMLTCMFARVRGAINTHALHRHSSNCFTACLCNPQRTQARQAFCVFNRVLLLLQPHPTKVKWTLQKPKYRTPVTFSKTFSKKMGGGGGGGGYLFLNYGASLPKIMSK